MVKHPIDHRKSAEPHTLFSNDFVQRDDRNEENDQPDDEGETNIRKKHIPNGCFGWITVNYNFLHFLDYGELKIVVAVDDSKRTNQTSIDIDRPDLERKPSITVVSRTRNLQEHNRGFVLRRVGC